MCTVYIYTECMYVLSVFYLQSEDIFIISLVLQICSLRAVVGLANGKSL